MKAHIDAEHSRNQAENDMAVINFYSDSLGTVGTQAAVLAGFAFGGLGMRETWLDPSVDPRHRFIFVNACTASISCNVAAVAVSTFASIQGPKMGLLCKQQVLKIGDIVEARRGTSDRLHRLDEWSDAKIVGVHRHSDNSFSNENTYDLWYKNDNVREDKVPRYRICYENEEATRQVLEQQPVDAWHEEDQRFRPARVVQVHNFSEYTIKFDGNHEKIRLPREEILAECQANPLQKARILLSSWHNYAIMTHVAGLFCFWVCCMDIGFLAFSTDDAICMAIQLVIAAVAVGLAIYKIWWVDFQTESQEEVRCLWEVGLTDIDFRLTIIAL